jgi:hypothetical protein
MLGIPISSDAPHFSQEHQIFGKTYVIEFEWIEQEKYWVMHLYDGSGQPIALGLKVSMGWPIFCEKELQIAFILIAKKPHAELNLSKFYSDFTLVVYALI